MLFLALTVALAEASDPTPRPWHSQWSMPFHEVLSIVGKPSISNEGAWYYDWANRRSRFDHLKGQKNNFCACANNATDSDCHLVFSDDKNMYVHFPTLNECCILCTAEIGCGTLVPTWMSDGNYTYKGSFEYANKTKCYRWSEPGAVATDMWASTLDDVDTPCQYKETFGAFATHTLNFYLDEFQIGPPDPKLFEVPSICNKKCANQFPADCH